MGYATGNYFGILLEEKLSIGNVVIRVIPKKDTSALIDAQSLPENSQITKTFDFS
jgi:uncharacterized protein YebE (UPF0316 family)